MSSDLMAFGGGRRVCPGMGFAMGVVEVALANLLYHFDWEVPGGEELEMSEGFKEECEKLKEENNMLRDTHEMEIRKGILAHKASPGYHTELKDFMIKNGDFLITYGWNKYVTHLRHKYPITDNEAKDPDS
ncbi:hypothetical protein Scep_021151 [Stephania cephalantha]|uniref:Cytochrome P450 n=1 Tax=Stephania cephalantha TaxID=152367 RepID=A0AAP0I003_9MAGN